MHTAAQILLGLINIAIVIALLLMIGAIFEWLLHWLAGIVIPQTIRKIFLALVAFVALYMLVAVIAGMPSIRVL